MLDRDPETGEAAHPGALPTELSRDEQKYTERLRSSGLFDEDWYRSQLPYHLPVDADPVAHFVTRGFLDEISCNAAFDPAWYMGQPGTPRRLEVAPILHYINRGAARGEPPHQMFDARAYLEDYPGSSSYPGGPLGHYLNSGTWQAEQDSGDAEEIARSGRWWNPDNFYRAARKAATVLGGTRGYEHLERDRGTFDFEAEATFKASLREQQPLHDETLVSVVLPTRNRAHILSEAIDSVINQTYTRWELIVVDDGSRDETAQLMTSYVDDERVNYVQHETSHGVAAARNSALRKATGEYIAYLDSDNHWRKDFLELMLRFMRRDGHRVAYAMSALVEEGGNGRRRYRGMPFVRGALEERNFIDCIVLMHERDLLEQTGVFDESLRRNVDWDLFIRFARVTDFGFAPFIATEYDVWEAGSDRITTDIMASYRYRVRQRTLIDWEQLRRDVPERDAGATSVVLVATKDAATTTAAVDRLLAAADRRVEVVIVDSRLPEHESVALQFAYFADARVVFHRLSQPLPLELSRNVGASVSSGSMLVFVPETAWPEPGWVGPLVDALDDYAVVQPRVLSPGGSIWSAGVSFSGGGRPIQNYLEFAGDAPEVRDTRPVAAVSAMCLAVRASDYMEVEGFDPMYVRHYTGPDLSLRLTTGTDRGAARIGESVVALREEPPEPSKASSLMTARDNDRHLLERHGPAVLAHANDGLNGHDGYNVVGFNRATNRQLEPRPMFVHDRPDRPLRWAIKIGAPTVQRRTNWGDWHFAVSLRNSLERLGHEVTIDCKDQWYRSTAHLDDVVLVLRGVSVYEINPGHTNVCWVISHPDRVEAREVSDYDLVFGASRPWCENFEDKLGRSVRVLQQCTDHHQFHPTIPDRRRAHQVLAVANARGVRPAVAATLEAGIVPSVYGLRWEGLLPDGAWKGEYLPNDELAAVYRAAGVVLNDHWDDMRDNGLLSNRLFDLAACEARVISDYMPQIAEVFGDVVLTYRSSSEIPELVATQLHETPERRQERETLGARVRQEHTFDARAATLSESVRQFRSGEFARAK